MDHEVKNGCSGVCSETDLAALLAGTTQQLAERRSHSGDKVKTARAALNRLFEERGQLTEQLRVLGDDHGIGRKRLQLGVVEQRLQEAVEQWQVLATTRMILESIKHDYERNRQPETLREASGYLTRLTGGRYVRVWTPLGEETLRVDDADGHALPIEVLSRGTREQLFLSLRMALVGVYARRGATMPFVLDDVLVNFDIERARAAAAVLRDFAAAGHQLLVFTCHEHLASLFESLDMHVRACRATLICRVPLLVRPAVLCRSRLAKSLSNNLSGVGRGRSPSRSPRRSTFQWLPQSFARNRLASNRSFSRP